ncbi:MAG TPA: hypothetical protein VLA46_07165 [Saprospiraceae bacterium]|nr:hypothetical protein [Saprospiraceae bacterium]
MTNSASDSSSREVNNKNVEINVWLDSYDEMFSDFDPRPYAKRTVSDDFIIQVRKIVKDRYREKMTLQLLLPETVRNKQDEDVIAERIHTYCNLIKDQLLEEKRKIMRAGFILTVTGIVFMLIASYVSFLKSDTFYTHALLILFEPAGWFMLWMGLDKMVYYSGSKRKELDFYTHMASTEILFGTYSPDGTPVS